MELEWEEDPDAEGEQRRVLVGLGFSGNVLTVTYTWGATGRESFRRARPPAGNVASTRKGKDMRDEYDFSQGRRGAVAPEAGQKTRITAFIDNDVLKALKERAQAASEASGAKVGYQTVLNSTLREALGLDPQTTAEWGAEAVSGRPERSLDRTSEERLRQIIREELERNP